jgi:nucleotide-binding universal stress UspA family protein
MRVLLAIDGSAPADRARQLVGGLPWPPGSEIRVAAALEPSVHLLGLPWRMAPLGQQPLPVEETLVRRLTDALDTAVRDLERADLVVDRILLRGRPASAIVEEARDFGADLVVVGNRGHGTLETMLLGSVSAEVVDHAPCPVLVARNGRIRSILFAHDGSDSADHAALVLREWPIFRDVPVTVISVADVALPWSAGIAPGIYDEVLESYNASVDEARRQHEEMAQAVADQLRDVGYKVMTEVREGNPAEQIVAYVKAHPIDLVVMGTRGHTGLARLLLGSVARRVLVHAPTSVLVVREKAHVGPVDVPAGGDGGR